MTKISDLTTVDLTVQNAPTHIFRNPVYICPVHGEVSSTIHVFLGGPHDGRYCQRCWAAWMAQFVFRVTEKEQPAAADGHDGVPCDDAAQSAEGK